jgi:hypothetical protein
VLALVKEPILEENDPSFVQLNLEGARLRVLCQPLGRDATSVIPVACAREPASGREVRSGREPSRGVQTVSSKLARAAAPSGTTERNQRSGTRPGPFGASNSRRLSSGNGRRGRNERSCVTSDLREFMF